MSLTKGVSNSDTRFVISIIGDQHSYKNHIKNIVHNTILPYDDREIIRIFNDSKNNIDLNGNIYGKCYDFFSDEIESFTVRRSSYSSKLDPNSIYGLSLIEFMNYTIDNQNKIYQHLLQSAEILNLIIYVVNDISISKQSIINNINNILETNENIKLLIISNEDLTSNNGYNNVLQYIIPKQTEFIIMNLKNASKYAINKLNNYKNDYDLFVDTLEKYMLSPLEIRKNKLIAKTPIFGECIAYEKIKYLLSEYVLLYDNKTPEIFYDKFSKLYGSFIMVRLNKARNHLLNNINNENEINKVFEQLKIFKNEFIDSLKCVNNIINCINNYIQFDYTQLISEICNLFAIKKMEQIKENYLSDNRDNKREIFINESFNLCKKIKNIGIIKINYLDKITDMCLKVALYNDNFEKYLNTNEIHTDGETPDFKYYTEWFKLVSFFSNIENDLHKIENITKNYSDIDITYDILKNITDNFVDNFTSRNVIERNILDNLFVAFIFKSVKFETLNAIELWQLFEDIPRLRSKLPKSWCLQRILKYIIKPKISYDFMKDDNNTSDITRLYSKDKIIKHIIQKIKN